MNNLLSADFKIRHESILAELDSGNLDVSAVISAIKHHIAAEGPKANIGTFVWALDESEKWNGEDRELIETIAKTGNYEALMMARRLLSRGCGEILVDAQD